MMVGLSLRLLVAVFVVINVIVSAANANGSTVPNQRYGLDYGDGGRWRRHQLQVLQQRHRRQLVTGICAKTEAGSGAGSGENGRKAQKYVCRKLGDKEKFNLEMKKEDARKSRRQKLFNELKELVKKRITESGKAQKITIRKIPAPTTPTSSSYLVPTTDADTDSPPETTTSTTNPDPQLSSLINQTDSHMTMTTETSTTTSTTPSEDDARKLLSFESEMKNRLKQMIDEMKKELGSSESESNINTTTTTMPSEQDIPSVHQDPEYPDEWPVGWLQPPKPTAEPTTTAKPKPTMESTSKERQDKVSVQIHINNGKTEASTNTTEMSPTKPSRPNNYYLSAKPLPLSVKLITTIGVIASFFILLALEFKLQAQKHVNALEEAAAAVQRNATSGATGALMMMQNQVMNQFTNGGGGGFTSSSASSSNGNRIRDVEVAEQIQTDLGQTDTDSQQRREKKERVASKLDFISELISLKTFINIFSSSIIELINHQMDAGPGAGGGQGGGVGGDGGTGGVQQLQRDSSQQQEQGQDHHHQQLFRILLESRKREKRRKVQTDRRRRRDRDIRRRRCIANVNATNNVVGVIVGNRNTAAALARCRNLS